MFGCFGQRVAFLSHQPNGRLLEVLTIVVILGVLAGIVIPAYTNADADAADDPGGEMKSPMLGDLSQIRERGFLRVPQPKAAQQTITFRVKLPGPPYPYRGRLSKLDYLLILRLEIPWATDPEMRVPILPVQGSRPRRRPLRVRGRRRTR